MILEMREAESSTKLNRFQQTGRISLKQNVLKIGDFLEIAATALGTVGRPSCASLDSTTWKTRLVECRGTLGNSHLQFRLQFVGTEFLACGSAWKENHHNFRGGGSAPAIAAGGSRRSARLLAVQAAFERSSSLPEQECGPASANPSFCTSGRNPDKETLISSQNAVLRAINAEYLQMCK
jgi:hypothetical protein